MEVQSLFDRERRRQEKVAWRLRRSDPARAERLRAALADVAVDDQDWPRRVVRLFTLTTPELRNPRHWEKVLRALERGVERVEQLEPPAELASWHAAVVASQRRYVAAMRQFQQAGTGRDASAVAEAAERVEHARKAVDAAMSAVSGR